MTTLHRSAGVAARAAILALAASAPALAAPAAPAPATVAHAPQARRGDAPATSTSLRIVVVQWKIRHGQERAFLDYWATQSTIPDRSGLVAEFMTTEEDRARFPWINWSNAESGDYATFYNVGLWRDSSDFMAQIGRHIDNARPPMPFEAGRRERIFLSPSEWRVGGARLPRADAAGVR